MNILNMNETEAVVSNPKDIIFRKQGGLVTVKIKVGPKWVDRSGGWHTKAEAMAPAIALRDELQAKYAEANPVADNLQLGDTANPDANGLPNSGRRFKSLRQCADEALEKYIKRQRLRDYKNIRSSLKWAWEVMGTHADLPPKCQQKATFTRIRNKLVDGVLAQATKELYSKNIRLVLSRVAGLDPEFLTELQNLPKTEVVTEASGDPFQRSHFKIMFELINTMKETIQILFWIGASGGPQIVDTVFVPFWAINWTTGLISYRRIKTGEPIEFCALPPLLVLLRKRWDRMGPDAVYVLPELIFKVRDLKNPACNTKGWNGFVTWKDMKVPQHDAVRGAAHGSREMTVFLKHCGIKAEGITHKSFRKHNISFWASIGIKLKTRMRMAGHSDEESHYRYDVPAEFEIIRAKDITWRYYQSIMEGEDFWIPTTPYDMYESLMAHWAKFPEIMQASMREELKGTLQSLHDALRTAFDSQKALIEAQTKVLQGENSQLREQLSTQEKQLQEILTRCDKLTKHFGLV
jgi:hypothetical protein